MKIRFIASMFLTAGLVVLAVMALISVAGAMPVDVMQKQQVTTDALYMNEK